MTASDGKKKKDRNYTVNPKQMSNPCTNLDLQEMQKLMPVFQF